MAKCQNPPMFRYTWPGKDEAYICFEHAQQLQAVANAIGLYLQLILLSGEDQMRIALADLTCSQEVKDETPIVRG